jgi:molecular chaperone HscB
MLNLQDDFFTLFKLPRTFMLDKKQLAQAYLTLQTQYHPDRAAHLTLSEQQPYLAMATHINAGYRTLKNALSRARYLLQLSGVDAEEETNTAMPTEFLIDQMQWRENIITAKQSSDIVALEAIQQTLYQNMMQLEKMLEATLDHQADLSQAALLVRKYRFYEKLDEDINNTIESLAF